MAKAAAKQGSRNKSGSKNQRISTAKDAALERTIAQIEKQYGKGSIMQMDEHMYAKIEGIPTGSLSLDIALGGNGIPARPYLRIFRPRIFRQNDACPARHRQCPEIRRRRGLYRCRARPRYHMGKTHRR